MIHPDQTQTYIKALQQVSSGYTSDGYPTFDAQSAQYAAHALGSLKSIEGVTVLCHVLLRSSDSTLGMRAAWALGEIGEPSSIPALVDALVKTNQIDVMGHCHSALQKFGTIAIPYLQATFNTSQNKEAKQRLKGAIRNISPAYYALTEGL